MLPPSEYADGGAFGYNIDRNAQNYADCDILSQLWSCLVTVFCS